MAWFYSATLAWKSTAVDTQTLARASIVVQLDCIDRYVAAHREWEQFARRVAPTLGYEIDEIDASPN